MGSVLQSQKKSATNTSPERILSQGATAKVPGVTFKLKRSAKSEPIDHSRYADYLQLLYHLSPVQEKNGKILVMTEAEGEHVIKTGLKGLIGTLFTAYNEHRHLILRPDDIWLAIVSAFSIYVNSHAEEMRDHFVSFEGQQELVIGVDGSMASADWNHILGLMSELIEKNTKTGTHEWLEPDFSTTTPVCTTVGHIAMMGTLHKYFSLGINFCCGIPMVTLEGTLDDWTKLRTKAAHLKSFHVECLTHWADLLDHVLIKLIKSFEGNPDKNFWSHIRTLKSWGSGPCFFEGWATVFIPFHFETGDYLLSDAKPRVNRWGKINSNHIPQTAVEVPVKLTDITGEEYETIFYGGHLATIYNPSDDSVRPSVDWLIADITREKEGTDEMTSYERTGKEDFPKPATFVYGA